MWNYCIITYEHAHMCRVLCNAELSDKLYEDKGKSHKVNLCGTKLAFKRHRSLRPTLTGIFIFFLIPLCLKKDTITSSHSPNRAYLKSSCHIPGNFPQLIKRRKETINRTAWRYRNQASSVLRLLSNKTQVSLSGLDKPTPKLIAFADVAPENIGLGDKKDNNFKALLSNVQNTIV
jgi:hypothetical protein